MRSVTVLVCTLLGAACLPRSRPAQPMPVAQSAPAVQPAPPVIAHTQAAPPPAPSTASNRDPTLFAQPQPQPYPQPQQPYPPQGPPQPYPQPPPQQPYPPQGPPQQPYPPQGPPQPYPPQGQPPGQQPQPYPQPYPQPAPYPPPAPYPQPVQLYGAPYPPPAPGRRLHSGEVVGDFATVGALASIDILVRQNVDNGGTGTLVMLAGVGGGGALGWLLAEKYPVDAGAAHATTIGLLAGTANGALLIRPTEAYDAEDVMALLFFGSAIGAAGGFAYGQAADLTPGQSTFLGNTVLLGTATAALTGILGSQNGQYDNWENGTLAIGLDAGLIAGAVVAPTLDWSPRRANLVLAATALGALIGGMVPGLVTRHDAGESYDGDLIAGAMTAGLWAGFGLGVVMTRDAAPDPKYGNPGGSGPVRSAQRSAHSTSYLPFVGDRGQMGVMAGGTW